MAETSGASLGAAMTYGVRVFAQGKDASAALDGASAFDVTLTPQAAEGVCGSHVDLPAMLPAGAVTAPADAPSAGAREGVGREGAGVAERSARALRGGAAGPTEAGTGTTVGGGPCAGGGEIGGAGGRLWEIVVDLGQWSLRGTRKNSCSSPMFGPTLSTP